jgi:hypothetical protein
VNWFNALAFICTIQIGFSQVLDRAIVIHGHGVNELNLPKNSTALWVKFLLLDLHPKFKDGKVFPITFTNEHATITGVISLQSPGIIPARLRIGNQWGAIQPIIYDDILVTNVLALGHCSLGNIPSSGVAKMTFKATKGNALLFEVVANRLGSKLDPTVRILDSRGKELVNLDDDVVVGRDCRITFRPPRTGEYAFEIRDVANGTGPDYFFALRSHNERNPKNVHWEAAESLLWLDETQILQRRLELGFFKEFENSKPNDSPASSDRAEIPFKRIGAFDKPGDIDWFEFETKTNQRLVCSVITRAAGSPCDAQMSLFQKSGVLLAESVGAGAMGPSITNEFKSAGLHRLRVKELSNRGGEMFTYLLEVKEPQPGVELSTESERVAFKDGEALLKISCVRFGYDGPVKFKTPLLPSGVEIVSDTIPGKKNDGELKLKANGKIEAFNIRITGEIEQKETKGTKSFPVSTMPALRKLYPLMMFPSAAMDGWIAVNPPQ